MATFALQTALNGSFDDLRNTARRAEATGFETLYLPDHPGTTASPLVALGAVAQHTERIRLGPCVTNVGVREPIQIASDAATLDVISGGRVILGLGAGHTPGEWRAIGAERPGPGKRIDRLVETVPIITRLLAGQSIDFVGSAITVHGTLDAPQPLQQPIPLMIGGGNQRLLEFAGAHADVVGLSGLGRTLDDGHRHETRFGRSEVEHAIEAVRRGASGRTTLPAVEALVQFVSITHDRRSVAAGLADRIDGLTREHALDTPFLLIGTRDEIVRQLVRHERELGITRFVVRGDALDAIAPILDATGD